MTEQDCIFCRIGRGDVPAEKVYDDGEAFAIRDINPKAQVHILVIPHAHVGALAGESAASTAAARALPGSRAGDRSRAWGGGVGLSPRGESRA